MLAPKAPKSDAAAVPIRSLPALASATRVKRMTTAVVGSGITGVSFFVRTIESLNAAYFQNLRPNIPYNGTRRVAGRPRVARESRNDMCCVDGFLTY